MTDFDETNRGVLNINENKVGKQPDYRGKINVDGRELELAGWKRVRREDGKTFLSLKVQEPYQRPEAVAEPSRPNSLSPPASPWEMDDEIPF